MTRGCSLVKDLRILINNSKYSDVEIICEDGLKLYGCRAILAARSEVFDRMLYNGMKESYENQIFFPEINSSSMKIVMEFLYTGSDVGDSLTDENIIGVYHAADYLQLTDLQGFIIETLRGTLDQKFYYENIAPELLTKAIDKMSESAENPLLTLLTESVAKIPLNTIDHDRLSFAALQYLLSYTFDKDQPFATSEYEVLRFGAIQAAYQISKDAATSLGDRLPALNQINCPKKLNLKVYDKFIINRPEIVEILAELIDYIDFRRIDGKILLDVIDPLGIVPTEMFVNAYRFILKNKGGLPPTRGIPYGCNRSGYVWDKKPGGSLLSIDKGGAVVRANKECLSHQNARARVEICDRGVYEWDVIIERSCSYAWVGICASENFLFDGFVGLKANGWVFGSNGQCYSNNKCINYGSTFGEGDIITVHLNMDNRTCAFSINGKRYPTVSSWTNLPSKVHPMVSLKYPGKFRIQLH